MTECSKSFVTKIKQLFCNHDRRVVYKFPTSYPDYFKVVWECVKCRKVETSIVWRIKYRTYQIEQAFRIGKNCQI